MESDEANVSGCLSWSVRGWSPIKRRCPCGDRYLRQIQHGSTSASINILSIDKGCHDLEINGSKVYSISFFQSKELITAPAT